jgi:hypothetical protein
VDIKTFQHFSLLQLLKHTDPVASDDGDVLFMTEDSKRILSNNFIQHSQKRLNLAGSLT